MTFTGLESRSAESGEHNSSTHNRVAVRAPNAIADLYTTEFQGSKAIIELNRCIKHSGQQCCTDFLFAWIFFKASFSKAKHPIILSSFSVVSAIIFCLFTVHLPKSCPTNTIPSLGLSWWKEREYFLFLVLINRTPFHVLRGTMVMLCWLCFYLDRLLRCISYFIIVWHVRFLELWGHCWKQELACKHEWMQIPFELETSDVLDCNIQQLRKYARSDWSKTYMIYYIGKRKEKGIRTLNPDHEP